MADRYRIERELGAGGMATVYLAEDLRHHRRVAIKVLRPELAAVLGGDRFVQEITTTAALQHPHILPLFDSGTAGGFLYYVMPYVEGETLRAKLDREKQLAVDEAVRIAREVASALDYAHRHGVVHRDIKPENILLHDGQALVADFGIALAVSRSDGGTRMTETGMSLGTPHYMSPEQAMGEREITARSDVYALGCITYEMLTGDPPFTGSTAQAIVARVVTETPRSLTAQRRTVPPQVEAAVLTALEKLPADRFASAAEFAEALEGRGPTRATRAIAAAGAAGAGRWRTIAIGAGAVAVVAVIAAVAAWRRPRPEAAVVRYSLGLTPGQGIIQGVNGVNLALSDDGRRFVYLGPGERSGQLWLRDRSRLDAVALAGTDGAINPVFSPDGRQIAFSTGSANVLKVVPADGGPPTTLIEDGTGGAGGLAWSDDGWIYYDANLAGFGRIRATGGPAEIVVPLDSTHGEVGFAWPQVLPGGRQLLLRARRGVNPDDFDLIVVDLKTRSRHVLTKGLLARYLPPGYLVYVRSDGALLAARFQPGDTAFRGPAAPILDGVMTKSFGSVDLTLSRDGTLLYVPGSTTNVSGELAWVGRDGAVTPLQPSVPIALSVNRGMALSPDGSRLVVDQTSDRSMDLWVKQLPSGPISRLTFDGSVNLRPSWTPDGSSVVFLSNRDSTIGVWVQRADGSAAARRIFAARDLAEAFLSHDGKWLVYRVNAASRDVYAIRPGQDSTPVPLLTTRFNEQSVALSPDGAWLAYSSDESGNFEVYVRPFPHTADGRWQVSTGGGSAIRWSHSGRELFYVNRNSELMVVAVTGKPTFQAGPPHLLFSLGSSLWSSNIVPYYDLSPDDKRFIMVRQGASNQAPGAGQMVAVEHWLREVEAKLKAGQQ